ncbi:MAG: GtrA family protein, partial [Desulfurococcaceae archaeon]
MSELECVEQDSRRICAHKPWIEVALEKVRRLNLVAPALLASSISLYRRILLMLLDIKIISVKSKVIVWGFVGSDNTNNIAVVPLSYRDWSKVYSFKLPKNLALMLSDIRRVSIYATVGASGVFVNLITALTVYSVLKGAGILANTVASTAGFELSVLWNFALHEALTFRDIELARGRRSVVIRLVKYHVVSVASWTCQVSAATMLPLLLRAHFFYAQLTGVALGFIANFILGFVYTWSS